MLEELRISNIGVIAQAGITFSPGFTVVTGETGAGKTMILTGVAMVMGAKADAAIVRTGSAQAGVDGTFRLSASSRASVGPELEELGADIDDDALIVSRTISGAGRTKAVLGGRSVPATTLADVAQRLIVVHGQADQARLRTTAWQRAAVDAYAGEALVTLLRDYQNVRARWRDARRELDERTGKRLERERQASLHRLALEEIDAVDPQVGEDESLDQLSALLSHAQSLRESLDAASESLVGDDSSQSTGAMGGVVDAQRAIDGVAHLSTELGALGERIKVMVSEIADVAAEINAFGRSIDSDPERLSTIEQRRHELGVLRKKYGPTLADVITWRDEVSATVADVDADASRIVELEASIASDTVLLTTSARGLAQLRTSSGADFALAITAELAQLAMPDAHVIVEVTWAGENGEFGPDGCDELAITMAPHQGAPARPIAKGASGGELSRLMLAMEVVLAGADPVPTFVFDEVDAGIGGKVAVEVGRRLALLSRSSQVIVVTHLPQVAAFADSHIVVEKASAKGVTSTTAREVTERERVGELVRMLSGLSDSDAGAAHAQELLDVAEGYKSSHPTTSGRVTARAKRNR